jgi:cytoskeleton protein RodZ
LAVPLFPRKRRGEPVESYPAVAEAEPPRAPRRVGDLLREARQGYGGSIEQIGAALRIRPAYLAAIEESRYDRLPGPTYALGFVRTYAEHLRLDGAEIARRFKAETSELTETTDLAFPMPLPERGKPGGTILIVALIIAGCTYATWYYLSSGERARPERVAEVPIRLLPPAPPPVPPLSEPPSPATSQPGLGALAAPSPTSPVPSVATPSLPPATAMAPAPTSPAPPALAPAPLASPAPAITAALPVPPPLSADELPAVPDLPTGAAAIEAPRVYGVTNGPARIVIKATGESWMQVRDGDSVVSVRTLKPGESYRVPDRPGLTMRTGNAGALEISVDGRIVPAVGPPGRSRNVALDPERLAAGRAVE